MFILIFVKKFNYILKVRLRALWDVYVFMALSPERCLSSCKPFKKTIFLPYLALNLNFLNNNKVKLGFLKIKKKCREINLIWK